MNTHKNQKAKESGNAIKGGFEFTAAESDKKDKENEGKLEGFSDEKEIKCQKYENLLRPEWATI